MAISLARGRRTTLAKVDAFADGVAVKTVRQCHSEPADGVRITPPGLLSTSCCSAASKIAQLLCHLARNFNSCSVGVVAFFVHVAAAGAPT